MFSDELLFITKGNNFCLCKAMPFHVVNNETPLLQIKTQSPSGRDSVVKPPQNWTIAMNVMKRCRCQLCPASTSFFLGLSSMIHVQQKELKSRLKLKAMF